MEDRIIKLEVQMEALHMAVDHMQTISRELTSEVREIQKSLNQIKYFAMGCCAILVANEMGLSAILKGVL